MHVETAHNQIETILADWKERIGADYLGYKGHVYRMFNFCLALRRCTEEEKNQISHRRVLSRHRAMVGAHGGLYPTLHYRGAALLIRCGIASVV